MSFDISQPIPCVMHADGSREEHEWRTYEWQRQTGMWDDGWLIVTLRCHVCGAQFKSQRLSGEFAKQVAEVFVRDYNV